MSARVNEAMRLLEEAQEPCVEGAPREYGGDLEAIGAARVLAILELAEQQRIANVLTFEMFQDRKFSLNTRALMSAQQEGLGL